MRRPVVLLILRTEMGFGLWAYRPIDNCGVHAGLSHAAAHVRLSGMPEINVSLRPPHQPRVFLASCARLQRHLKQTVGELKRAPVWSSKFLQCKIGGLAAGSALI
jgi:hypothetical protein